MFELSKNPNDDDDDEEQTTKFRKLFFSTFLFDAAKLVAIYEAKVVKRKVFRLTVK